MNAVKRHPDMAALALLAGGDLPLLERWMDRLHVLGCAACKAEYDAHCAARAALAADGSSQERALSGSQWAAIESEMRANVRLGLTAGALAGGEWRPAEVAAASPQPGLPMWRWAAVSAALLFVFSAGWWLQRPQALPVQVAGHAAQPAQTAARETGIELLAPASGTALVEADFGGGSRSTTIDRETGQVTLQQVYVE